MRGSSVHRPRSMSKCPVRLASIPQAAPWRARNAQQATAVPTRRHPMRRRVRRVHFPLEVSGYVRIAPRASVVNRQVPLSSSLVLREHTRRHRTHHVLLVPREATAQHLHQSQCSARQGLTARGVRQHALCVPLAPSATGPVPRITLSAVSVTIPRAVRRAARSVHRVTCALKALRARHQRGQSAQRGVIAKCRRRSPPVRQARMVSSRAAARKSMPATRAKKATTARRLDSQLGRFALSAPTVLKGHLLWRGVLKERTTTFRDKSVKLRARCVQLVGTALALAPPIHTCVPWVLTAPRAPLPPRCVLRARTVKGVGYTQ